MAASMVTASALPVDWPRAIVTASSARIEIVRFTSSMMRGFRPKNPRSERELSPGLRQRVRPLRNVLFLPCRGDQTPRRLCPPSPGAGILFGRCNCHAQRWIDQTAPPAARLAWRRTADVAADAMDVALAGLCFCGGGGGAQKNT